MLKARTEALQNRQNMIVLKTRLFELKYYTGVFDTILEQASIFAIFSIEAVVSIHWDSFTDFNEGAREIMLSTVVLAFGFGILTVLCCIWAVASGPGMALRGLEGSVISALEGMHEQRNLIRNSFVCCLVLYMTDYVAYVWIFEGPSVATICTLITFGSAFSWWHYCSRIYNRFRYAKTTALVDERRDQLQRKGKDLGRSSHIRSLAMTMRQMRNRSSMHMGPLMQSLRSADGVANMKYFFGYVHRRALKSVYVKETDRRAKRVAVASGLQGSWQRFYAVLLNDEMELYDTKEGFLAGEPPVSARSLQTEDFAIEALPPLTALRQHLILGEVEERYGYMAHRKLKKEMPLRAAEDAVCDDMSSTASVWEHTQTAPSAEEISASVVPEFGAHGRFEGGHYKGESTVTTKEGVEQVTHNGAQRQVRFTFLLLPGDRMQIAFLFRCESELDYKGWEAAFASSKRAKVL
jgi:hypothetical protein